MRRKALAAATFFAGAVALISSSGVFAAPLIQVGACSPTPCAFAALPGGSGFPFVSFGPDTVGTFQVTGTADTVGIGTLISQTITASTTTGGTLDLIFSGTGATGIGAVVFTSSFTSNQQHATTHSVTENTFFDPANGLFNNDPATLLSTATLSSAIPQTAGPFDVTRDSTLGTVSVAEEYVVTLEGGCTVDVPCSANLTIDLAAAAAPVPEPASLTLLSAALIGLGWLGRRSRRTVDRRCA